MKLDINTLFLVTVYVEAILGLLLFFAWAQNLAIRAVAWWGSSHMLRAASIALFGLYGSVSDTISIELSNAVLLTSFAAMWAGTRVFDGRKLSFVALLAGAGVWLAATRLPMLDDWIEARTLISSLIITAYIWLAAYEMWRGRDEPLVSRLPAFIVLFAYGCVYALHTPLSAYVPWSTRTELGNIWMAALSFEGLLFTISVAFIMLAMAKERTEVRHKTAAMIDPLTGIANRRGFLFECEEAMTRRPASGASAAVLLLDLDHFKSVNDRFGHGVGDRVLQIFAQAALENVRTTDIFGRLGGEEFAMLLPDVRRERALVTAERIRTAFCEAAAEVDGQPIGATVSIGVAIVDAAAIDLSSLLAQADGALYRAKERGRNRVEVAPADMRRNTSGSTATAMGETPASV